MLAATTGRDTIESWLRTDLVAIIMTISGAHVLMRVTAFIAEQQILQVKSQAGERDDLSVLTTGAHRAAVLGALRWGINFCIIAVAIMTVLLRLNLPSSALVFLCSIAGAGLGFGAQQMVGDVIAGLYIIAERQFGVGDIVRLGPLGIVGWVEGRVEEVTLRVTKIRTFDGDLVSIANGVLRQNVNMSRDWSRVLVSVPLPRESDMKQQSIASMRCVKPWRKTPSSRQCSSRHQALQELTNLAPRMLKCELLVDRCQCNSGK